MKIEFCCFVLSDTNCQADGFIWWQILSHLVKYTLVSFPVGNAVISCSDVISKSLIVKQRGIIFCLLFSGALFCLAKTMYTQLLNNYTLGIAIMSVWWWTGQSGRPISPPSGHFTFIFVLFLTRTFCGKQILPCREMHMFKIHTKMYRSIV